MPEGNNFWWIEIGGTGDTIAQTEEHRDELLKIAYGVGDTSRTTRTAAATGGNWVDRQPAGQARERATGDHILTQNDIEAEGRFED